jgi:hypothetical protein
MTKDIQNEVNFGAFLANTGYERTKTKLTGTQVIFSQGDPADCVYYPRTQDRFREKR